MSQLIIWLVALLFVGVGVLSHILLAEGPGRPGRGHRSGSESRGGGRRRRWFRRLQIGDEFPYEVKSQFLTRSERDFYHVLRRVFKGRDVAVFAQVRVCDIFAVREGFDEDFYLRQFAMHHVDFLVCQLPCLVPMVAVELDGESHLKPHQVENDRIKDQAFRSAGLQLVRFDRNDAGYDLSEVGRRLLPWVSGGGNGEAATGRSR